MRRALASALRHRTGARRDQIERCIASGWQLHRACTDGRGHAVCPACTRLVRMRPLRLATGDRSAWVVETHAGTTLPALDRRRLAA